MSPPVYASYRDCLSYLAPAETVRDLLLAAERVSAGGRITRTVSAGSHFSWTIVSAGSKRSRTVSTEAKYDGQSLQEAKISGLDNTL